MESKRPEHAMPTVSWRFMTTLRNQIACLLLTSLTTQAIGVETTPKLTKVAERTVLRCISIKLISVSGNKQSNPMFGTDLEASSHC